MWHAASVAGHRHDVEQDKMILYYADGSLREIARWKECECRLGTDWVIVVQKNMAAQAGQPIQLEVANGTK